MNTSQFMDKQIRDLSNSKNNNDFIALMDTQQDHIGTGKIHDIEPSYDFQQPSQQTNLDSNGVLLTRVWNSAVSKTYNDDVGSKNYSSLDTAEHAKNILEKDRNADDAALVSEIDKTMKKHADNILHALEGVSARISQLESRTRHLENSVDDLKISAGNNHGSTDGQLRQLENILREVQAGVRFITDKQEMITKIEPQSETQKILRSENLQQSAPAPQQSHQQFPLPTIQPPSTLSPPNAFPTASQQNLPPSVQLPNQFPPNPIPSMPQREHYFPPPGQSPEPVNQHFQLPPPQQSLPPLPAAPPPPQHQPPPHPQYSQPPPPPQNQPSLSAVYIPQPQTSLGHHPEERPYAPPQNYPPSLHQPPHSPTGNPPSQHFYGSHMFEPPSSSPNPGFPLSYGPSSGTNELHSYSGSMKQQQLSSAAAQGSGSAYPQLPTARILPQALPTASGVGGGSGSVGSGNNRVPIDDVVDKLSTMGFTKDQVRATVRKLIDNGQSVDLNVVLDKLNDGEGQPQRHWYGR
ncbi:Pollen-specific leucine-rich repeat extensin-like protein [Actinidia chinensis var. chinensis]|uniref:Pollen-specific leucine-rich repeat extensin-like protein n=1 Tax=Actinidia chinensis var. chinensis TaxID=1590841 RepID=A0A2R6RZ00_ACTCC|nr:Pollen-specific leucine-rich repeat extensin-like protein [Actinidia chinensis var. chinensis]